MNVFWQQLMVLIQSLGFVTQSAHFFSGWAITLTASRWLGWWAPVAFIVCWVIPKEFVFDSRPWGEGHGSPDLLDATFYSLGTAVACGLMAL